MEEWPDECPRVVFCSDVFGVYDSPPTTRIINADADASDGTRVPWRCARASPLARLAEAADAAALDAAIAIASYLPPGPPRVFLARPGAFAAEPSRVSDHALNAILAFDARGAPDDA